MKHILALLLLVSTSASAQSWNSTGTKTRFVNGLGLPVKTITSPGAADTALIFINQLDTTRPYWRFHGALLPIGAAPVNIYNSDGTLAGDREVKLGGYDLLFDSGRHFTVSLPDDDATSINLVGSQGGNQYQLILGYDSQFDAGGADIKAGETGAQVLLHSNGGTIIGQGTNGLSGIISFSLAGIGMIARGGWDSASYSGVTLNLNDSAIDMGAKNGLLLPRLTLVQRNLMNNPLKGTIVYLLDSSYVTQYNGSAWIAVGSSGGSSSLFPLTGTDTATGDVTGDILTHKFQLLSSTDANQTPTIYLDQPTGLYYYGGSSIAGFNGLRIQNDLTNSNLSTANISAEGSDAAIFAYDKIQLIKPVRLNSYGTGTITGTPTYNLSVDVSGNVIETSGGTTTNALSAGLGLAYNTGSTFDGSAARTLLVDTANASILSRQRAVNSYVNLTTAQTIAGAKTLTDNLAYTNAKTIYNPTSAQELININRPTSYTGGMKYTVQIQNVSNGDGTYNSPVVSGFNAYGQENASYGGNYLSLEPDYRPGGAKYKEYHYEVYHPYNSETSRLFSSTYVENDSLGNSTNQWDFRANHFYISPLKGSAQFAAFSGDRLTGSWDAQFLAPNSNSGIKLQGTGSGATTYFDALPVSQALVFRNWSSVTIPNPTLTGTIALGTPTSVTLTNATSLPLTTGVTGILPVANGGTGTASPGIVAGTNVTVTGTWPNQTVNATNAAGASLTVANTFTTNGALSAPAELYTGTWITGGTATTTKPYFLIEPSGATSTLWNTSGTALGINAASGFTGSLADFQLNGSSVFKVAANGSITANSNNITLSGIVNGSITTTSNQGGNNAYVTFKSNAGTTFFTVREITSSVLNPTFNFTGTQTMSSSYADAIYASYNPTLSASANNQVINLIDANPTFTNGAFTGVVNNLINLRQSAVSKFKVASDGTATLTGNTIFSTAGKGVQYQSGTGARAGNATLVAGTVTVTNTTVTANTVITLTRKTAGGTLGNITYTLSAGASFTINSDSGTDTSVITYVLSEVN